MRYKIGAEQLQQVPSLVHRHRRCRLRDKGDRLQVLDQDWETACFVQKCPGCFAAVVTKR
jgi:hypothetical protein